MDSAKLTALRKRSVELRRHSEAVRRHVEDLLHTSAQVVGRGERLARVRAEQATRSRADTG